MKLKYWLAIVLTAAFGSHLALAQAPSGAPSGSTGQCRDGSYTTAAKKAGACSGHKGVQTWFATTDSAPTTTNAMAPGQDPAATGTPATKPFAAPPAQGVMTGPSSSAPASQSGARSAAPGGGPGMVWVNTASKVYHCPGTEYYGKTKNGKYMSEADAIAMGARADHNKACPK